ncbi:helix-turn-helix transcriptional regulator [Sphingomonas sp. KR1UV-12]|uniref:Helix-turn-helix transcriptional regulator n=1 Tax=Sphingomonas aurea TaxID=3063994 RepID=A0ABT9EJW5_9SPHN|nr:AraC family transcriptional regulator [Sphingomonas sp. KR1UV-12]MDP1027257.1 helix-turn-helix transcriptional regulator [Sphingomonas sp. KR1UV-12]
MSATSPALEPAHGFALLWTTDALRIQHAGRDFELRDGDLAIIDRSLPLACDGGPGWSARLLELGDRRIGARIDDRQRFVGVPMDGGSDLAMVVKRLWLMLEDTARLQLGRSEPGDDLVEARLIEILTDLAARLAAQVVDIRLTSHDAATIERAQVLIAAHLSDPDFGVAELAALMRVSARHLSSLFARVNTTTSHAILTARLTLARRLLVDPVNARRPISSVAHACGFDDQSYFARCFRREIGMTPRRFRAEGQDS